MASSIEGIDHAVKEVPIIQRTSTRLSFRMGLPFHINKVIRRTDNWVSIHIHRARLNIVAGATTRATSGPLLCHNRQWLSTYTKYTENILITVLTLRLFPRVFHRSISTVLPFS